MSKKQVVSAVSAEDFQRAVEELQLKVEAISMSVADLRKTGIRESVLIFLVQKSAQKYMPKKSVAGITEVKAVLDGLKNLDSYLFPPKKK